MIKWADVCQHKLGFECVPGEIVHSTKSNVFKCKMCMFHLDFDPSKFLEDSIRFLEGPNPNNNKPDIELVFPKNPSL